MSSKVAQVAWPSVGGPIWLDFVNTEIVERGEPRDLLENVVDYQAWLEQALARAGKSAGRRGHHHVHEQLSMAQVRQFRQTLRQFASGSLEGKEMSGKLVKEINQVLGTHVGFTQLRKREGGWETAFVSAEAAPSPSPLLPIAESLVEFVTTADLSRLHRCGNPECVLFFYDDTKNQMRRFCSSATCGNRVRVAAHYRRQRELRSEKKAKEL